MWLKFCVVNGQLNGQKFMAKMQRRKDEFWWLHVHQFGGWFCGKIIENFDGHAQICLWLHMLVFTAEIQVKVC